MADENLPPEQDPPTQGAPTAPPAETPEAPLGDAGKSALAAERKRANEAEKAKKAVEAELQKFRDKDKTDLEKLTEERDALAKQVEQTTSERNRERIARRHGLADDELDFLGQGSEEEVEARAVKLAALKTAATPAPLTGAPTKRPTESLKPGATPADQEPEDDSAYPAHWLPADAPSS